MTRNPEHFAELIELLAKRSESVSTAESCTGGGLGFLLTSASGSSAYYTGGVIAYANLAKENLLGVSTAILQTDGAVSSRCAVAMAEGCRKTFATTYAVSVTGIAGPTGGTDAKPVGTVFIGVAGPEESTARCFHFDGDRTAVREQSVASAISLLYAFIKGTLEK